MKRITDKKKYTDLLKIFVAQDSFSKDSVLKKIFINKTINYLFINLTESKKLEMLGLLREGLNEKFLNFASQNLKETDMEIIANAVDTEYMDIYNYSLIKQTDGN